VALMLRALIGGHGLGDGDLELLFQPFWDYLGQSLRHGRLPLWDPNLGAGLPFVASLQSEALYPPATVLFTLLPLHVATAVFLFGHLYFAAFGTERLARRLGWSPASAAGAGALVACAPMLLSSLVCPSRLAAVAWLPWTLLAGDRACAHRRGGVAALGVCVGLGLLCGQPEVTLLGALLVGAQAVSQAARGEWGAALRCLVGGLLGVGLVAVVLLPFAELVGQSARGADLHGMERAWSLGRGDFASLLLPFLNLDAPWSTFQEIFYGPFQRLIYVVYLGAPALALAGLAVWRGGRNERLLAVVAALALLLGAFGGEVSLLLEHVGLGSLAWRYSVKLIYPAAFAVALLAPRGAEALANESRGGRIGRVLPVAGGGLVLAAMLALHRWGDPLAFSLAWVGEGLLTLAAILRWVPPGPWRQWALILFCVVDASLCSLRIPFADHGSQCQPLLAAARARAGLGRVDATSGTADGAGFLVAEPGWQNHCLEGNLVAQFGLSSARYYGTPWPKGSQALTGRFGAVGDGLLGVTLVLRGHPEEAPGLVSLSAPELAPLWAAAIPGAAPRVELRPAVRVTSDIDAALANETLERARREVLLEDEPPPPSAPGAPYTGEDSARLIADRGEEIEIETASNGERYLVLADLDYSGWSATVDGQSAPIRRAYGALRALRLGPGRHRVSFDYAPRSLRRGLWITVFSTAALVVGAFF
jgi:hypothetical protein